MGSENYAFNDNIQSNNDHALTTCKCASCWMRYSEMNDFFFSKYSRNSSLQKFKLQHTYIEIRKHCITLYLIKQSLKLIFQHFSQQIRKWKWLLIRKNLKLFHFLAALTSRLETQGHIQNGKVNIVDYNLYFVVHSALSDFAIALNWI